MIIPNEDKIIGFEGDNRVEKRIFEVSNSALLDFDFKLDVKTSNGAVGIVDLVKTVEENMITLTWEILKGHIANGMLFIQLRAFSGNDEIWHSEIGCFEVKGSINAVEHFHSPCRVSLSRWSRGYGGEK